MTKGQNFPQTREKGPSNTAKSKEAATRAANLKKLPKTRPLEGPPHAVKSTTALMTEDSNDVEEDGALDTEEGEDERYYVARDVNTDDESAQAGPSKKAKTNDSNTRVTETHSSAMSTTDARTPHSATAAANTTTATSSNNIQIPSGTGTNPPGETAGIPSPIVAGTPSVLPVLDDDTVGRIQSEILVYK